MKKVKTWVSLLLLLLPNFAFADLARGVRLEAGRTFGGYNYFRIPNTESATRLDLARNAAFYSYRIYAFVPLSEKWLLRVLYAPLKTKYTTTSGNAVQFNNTTFAANQQIETTYKFNSYRVSAIRYFNTGERGSLHVGFTAKVRDAYIDLSNGQTSSRRSDLGFVPLLNFGGDWNVWRRFNLSGDVDALAGGPGRAIDGRVELQYMVNSWNYVALGYRVLEGGVKNSKVMNFAFFQTAYIGLEGYF